MDTKAAWSKRNYHQKKELRSQSGEVEQCDQCDYKTTVYGNVWPQEREAYWCEEEMHGM